MWWILSGFLFVLLSTRRWRRRTSTTRWRYSPAPWAVWRRPTWCETRPTAASSSTPSSPNQITRVTRYGLIERFWETDTSHFVCVCVFWRQPWRVERSDSTDRANVSITTSFSPSVPTRPPPGRSALLATPNTWSVPFQSVPSDLRYVVATSNHRWRWYTPPPHQDL